MLHLLRRIRKSLVDSNQFRKYTLYAIGEIALVVIGILIALQVNNWNQVQLEIQKEKAILEGLMDDVEGLNLRLETWANFNSIGERLTSKILTYTQDNFDRKVMDSLFSVLIYVNVLDKGGGPLEALIYTGSLDLIRHKEIHESLARLPDKLEDIHTNDLTSRQFVYNQFIPYLATYGIPEFNCPPMQFFCSNDNPTSTTYRNIIEDGPFKALLRHRYISYAAISMDHQATAVEVQKLLELIKEYLEQFE